jgi:hypothetical protein
MASEPLQPAAPDGLETAGRALWEAIVGDVPETHELDARELDHLERACRCADRITLLEAAVKREGVTVAGSRGQTALHPGIAEIRQTELARLRLLAALELPDGDEQPRSDAGRRGQRAARVRWERRDQLAEQRRKIAERGA